MPEEYAGIFFYTGAILILFLVPVSQIIPIDFMQYQTASAIDDIVLNHTNMTRGHVMLALSETPLSNYALQNLHGDTVDTWVAWNVPSGRTIHIHVTNVANLPQNMIDAVNDAILSTQSVTIDDHTGKRPKGLPSTYYVGWEGAINNTNSKPTKYHIPQKFDISGSPNEIGDIEIVLTNDVNSEGYSGYTTSSIDGNQILQSKIIIYRASNLDAGRLAGITRHEFGHALGLGHSTMQQDLMYVMLPEYPYISNCDIDALEELYNGDQHNKVVCKQ